MARLFTLAAAVIAAGAVQAFSSEEARALYVKNYTESPPSVQECGDYVFVIQEGVIDYDDPSGIKAAVLKGQLAAVEKFVGKSAGGMESPFPPALTERLLPLVSFKIPACKSCKVDELRLVGKFRHVSAFEAGPLRAARERAASGRPAQLSNAEWGGLIAEKVKSCDREGDKDALWAELGAAPVLVSRLGGVRWMVDHVDGVALCAAVAGWRSDATAKECNSILRLNPVFPQAHARLAALAEGEGDLVVALSRHLKGALSAPRQEAVSAVSARIAERSASRAWTEYAQLYARVLKESTLSPEGAAPMWKYLVHSLGHLEPSAVAQADAVTATRLFEEGRALFAGGRELERLTGLFRKSLELDPLPSVRWRYYAAALRAAGRHVDAVTVYNQVISMDPRDELAIADVGALYGKLGYPELAKGCAWYVLATSSDADVRGKAEQVLVK